MEIRFIRGEAESAFPRPSRVTSKTIADAKGLKAMYSKD